MRADKLTGNEKKVLSYIHLKADATYDEIARSCNIKSHTARNIIENLLKQKVITPYAVVNYSAISLIKYHVYFHITPSSDFPRDKIILYFEQHPHVAWLCDFMGQFNFGVSILVPHPKDLEKILREILIYFRGEISSRRIACETCRTYYGKRYVHEHTSITPINVSLNSEYIHLDNKDQALLSLLAKNCFTSQQEMADSLSIPLSTVNARLSSLKNKGVLAGFVYWISYSKLKIHAYRLLFNTGGLSDDQIVAIRQYADNNPFLVSLIFTTGSWDMEFGIDLEEKYHINTIISDVKSILSSPTFSVISLLRFDDIKMGQHSLR